MKSIKMLKSLLILMMLPALLTSVLPVQAAVSQIPLTVNGDLVWAKGVGGTNNDGGYGITTDTNGNSYTVGEFQNTVDFDPGSGTINLTSTGSTDGFISKFDSNSALVWVKQFGGTLADRAVELKLDQSDNLYITGYFRGTVDFDPGAGAVNMTSNGENDIFLLKLNSSGDFVWVKSFGSTQYDEGVDLVFDNANNIHLLSDFTGTVDFDPGIATYNLKSNSDSFFDIAVTKLDSNGNFIWAKSFGGISEDYAGGIVINNSGDVYISGNFDGTVDFDPGTDTFNLTSNFYDLFVSALDSNGQFLWAINIGGSGIDDAIDIAVDPASNLYLTGVFANTVDFDPGAGIHEITGNSAMDIYILKLNSNGNFIWVSAIGGSGDEFANDIELDSNQDIYISGSYTNTVDFDPFGGTTNLTSSGSNDIFIAKFNNSGQLVWAKSMGGITNDSAYGLALDSGKNIFTIGQFSDTADFDPGAGSLNLTSEGARDIFLVKLEGGISSITYKSNATNDGWVLEASETSNTGGSMNSAAANLLLGDDAADKQYRAILHFDTSALPDTAVVTSMTLKIKQQGNVTGTSPFSFGSLYVDMHNPAFGGSALELADFNFSAKKVKPAVFNPTPVSGWFSARFNNGGKLYVNRTGVSQLRLYFSVDDNNNNIADFIRFFSGNAAAGDRPKLLIQYYAP